MKNHKIFRSLFVIFIILSFNINSFAAISANDGVAFITKAEFAKDLDRFSQRISQIENTLEAKIDSLVSAYLSRNGIWNGSAQELKTGGYITSWLLNNNQKQFALQNPPNNFSSSPVAVFADNIYGRSLLFTANKSGMLCIAVSTCAEYNSTSDSYGTDNRRSFNITTNTGGFFNTGYSKGFYLAWEIIDQFDNVLCSKALAKPYLTFNNSTLATSGFMALYENFSCLLQCFVSKGDDIYNRIRFMYNLAGSSAASFTFSRQMNNTWNMLIKYCRIY